MAADDATEKDAPSTNDEPEDKEDVEGHRKLALQPEIEARAPRSSEDDKSDPVESYRGV
jgi:hypothetical protein